MSGTTGAMLTGAITALTAGAWILAPHAARRSEERELRHRWTGALALTYDDGPSASLTARVLDLLLERGAQATFFPLGGSASQYGALLDRVRAEGHAIGCHGHAHVHAWRCGPADAVADIDAGYASLDRWIDARAPFRPPYGKTTVATRSALRRRRAPLAWWTVDSMDSQADAPDLDQLVARVDRDHGGVVLMHDFDRGAAHASFVLAATTRLLQLAADRRWPVRSLFTSGMEARRAA